MAPPHHHYPPSALSGPIYMDRLDAARKEVIAAAKEAVRQAFIAEPLAAAERLVEAVRELEEAEQDVYFNANGCPND